jgi:hypothetical protein
MTEIKVRITSSQVDQITAEAIVLTFFHDERPLQGSTGLIDWKLNGKLSQFIVDEYIKGFFGETILLPSDTSTMKCQKIFLIGLGERKDYNIARFMKISNYLIYRMIKMKVKHFAIPLPGVALGEINYFEAAEIFVALLKRNLLLYPHSFNLTILSRKDNIYVIEAGINHALKKYQIAPFLSLDISR